MRDISKLTKYIFVGISIVLVFMTMYYVHSLESRMFALSTDIEKMKSSIYRTVDNVDITNDSPLENPNEVDTSLPLEKDLSPDEIAENLKQVVSIPFVIPSGSLSLGTSFNYRYLDYLGSDNDEDFGFISLSFKVKKNNREILVTSNSYDPGGECVHTYKINSNVGDVNACIIEQEGDIISRFDIGEDREFSKYVDRFDYIFYIFDEISESEANELFRDLVKYK